MRDALFFSKLRVMLCGWRWKSYRRASWLKARWRQMHRRVQRLARDRFVSSPSNPSSSSFLLEPLESRLLLAADLTGVVQSAVQLDPAVPTNTASAVVQVQNVGNQNVSQSQIGVYASLDTTLDASDVLLGTANTGQLNAGQSKNVTTNLTIPNSLDALTYRLLAKLDHANTISENSEANNLAVGGTINVKWQFGTVPGRSGSMTLTLKDADGTTVTFGLSGPGLGEVIKDGASWDLKVTGTTASSAVTITTNNGGNGRVTLNDIHVFGPLSTFLAATTDLTGTMAIDGPVNIPGAAPGTLTLGSIQGGTVAVPSVEALTVLGAVSNAKFYIGTTFGQDGQPGGTGADADTYGAGTIGLFTVTGAMTNTAVRVGINPVDGLYGNGDDQLVGGTNSAIGGIVIGGSLSADTRFYAGRFPTQYLNGLTLKPTAGDVHFLSNFGGPTLNAALQQDTGTSNSDRLTNNPAITGSVNDPQGIATFTAGFGATPTFNILADRQANGSFALSPARLEQINGGPLADGPYTLTLRATDTGGNVTQTMVPFTLDTVVSAFTFDLDAASDSAPIGDQQTTNASVVLVGQTEANAAVELLGLGLTTTANASGQFTFTNVALTVGANAFTVRATDSAGNQRSQTQTITRVGVGNSAPVLAPIGNRSVNEGTELRFAVSASDTDVPSQPLVYSAAGLPVGATFDPATREFAWTPTEGQGPGVHQVTFSVTDGVATTSETITITVSEVNASPLLAPVGDRNVVEGAELRFTVDAADADIPIQALVYTASGLPQGANFNTATREFTWTPNESQGPGIYHVTFSVTDGFVSSSETIAITVTDVNAAPVLDPIGNKSVLEGNELRFTINGSDGDVPAQALVYSAAGLPQGAAFDPATREFVWTPNHTQGSTSYNVTFSLSDGLVTTSEAITITVTEVNQPPILNLIGNKTGSEGSLLTFQASVTDADVPAQIVTYSLENGLGGAVPVGASIDSTSGVFSWAPTEAQGPGTYTFDVVATDNGSPALSDRETITVTVNEINLAPGLSVPVAVSGDEQTLLTFTAVATDGDLPANQFTFSLQGTVPTGASIDPVSGVFSWTPTEAQGPGAYDITVRVTDNGTPNAFIEQTVRLTIGDANQSPAITSASAVAVPENQTSIMTVTASDADIPAQPLTFSVTGGADAAAFVFTSGGALSFVTAPNFETPSDENHDNVYEVTVQVSDGAGGIATQAVNVTVTNVVESIPTLAINDVTLAEGTSLAGNTAFNFTVTLSEPVSNTVTVQVATSDNGATAVSGDYTPISPTTLTFAPGETTKTVTVQVRQDDRVEGTEQFQVSLSAPTNATILDGAGFGTITNDDVRTLSVDDVTQTEGTSPAGFTLYTFTVTLSAQTITSDVTVQVATSDNGATAVSGDYTPIPPTTLTFAPGETTKTVTVQVRQDDRVEGTEQFQVSLSTPTNATILDGAGFGTITNDDVRTLSVDDVTQTEGTSPAGFTLYTFTVTLSAPTITSDVTVQVATSDNGATAASGDYTPVPPTTLTFGPNQTAQTVTVQVRQDDRVEGTEQFQVSLSAPTNATILDGSGFGTIIDDDVRSVSINDVTVTEGDSGTSAATFTVTLSQASPGTVTVVATTAADSATPGSDYTTLSQTLTFSPGTTQQTFSVPIVSDVLQESTEQFFVNLSNVSAGVVIADAQGIGTILDNDVNQAPVLAPIGNQTVNEGQLLQFNATATDPGSPTTFTFSLANGASGQVPTGATIAAGTGRFTWTPTEAQGPGSYTFDVVVTDSGTPALSDRETITVTVGEGNQAPALQAIPNQTVTAGQLLTFTAVGTDPDIPANGLTYSLEGVVPAGATIDSTTGVFSWTPTNAQLGLQSVTVRVTDSDSPSLFAQHVVSITVNAQANQAPVLAPIGNRSVTEESQITFTASATDTDLPAQQLTFSLQGTPPAGATITPGGVFTWTPTAGQGGAHTVTVRVMDNGSPASFDEETFTITVGAALSPSFQSIGDLAGGAFFSRALGVSGDGQIVAGAGSSAAGTEAISWTVAGGIVGLGNLGGSANEAFAASMDGSVVVGHADPTPGGGSDDADAFRWTSSTGLVSLGSSTDGAVDVSSDGTVVVGAGSRLGGSTQFSEAFRWTAAEGVVWLGAIPGLTQSSEAFGVSSDGQVVVGSSKATSLQEHAFRWDANTGLVDLGDLPGGGEISRAMDASLNGAVIVGAGSSANGFEAFRWTQATGLVGLGGLVAGDSASSEAMAVSDTGSVIVGRALGPNGFEAFVWDAVNGMRSLEQILIADLGVSGFSSHWTLTEATGLSADGRVIVGNGTNPLGQSEGWRVVLPATIPENQAPVLDPIGNHSVNEGSPLTFAATATDSSPYQTLTYSLTGTVPSGAAIDPATGVFTWTPTEAQGPGTYTFEVVVSDNSATRLSDSETITVAVNEVDENPVLNAIGNQSVNEGESVTFTATAIAPLQSQVLTFSLHGSVPAGASINPATGLFTWTTTEAQGPGTYQVTVRVADNGTPALFDEETISISVGEMNQAPVLSSIPDQTVMGGQTVTFAATASDIDVPANQLTYSFEGTVPTGAGIDPQTGLFTWATSAGDAGTYAITVRVTDDGTPVLFSERTFNVTVLSNAASFQGIGDLPGGTFSSRPFGVSGNGAVIVGVSDGGSGLEPFRWTVSGGIQNFSAVVGASAIGRAASVDGSVIAGDTDAGSFRWSVADGFQMILGNVAPHSANAVTPDGTVIVGKGQINGFIPGAFRWTAATGAVRLDTLAGYADAEAFGVSADGNVIVGASYFGPLGEQAQAVRWVADGSGGFTVEGLGDLPGGNFMSRAVAVSADGNVILGISESDRGQEAFLWTASGGMQGLGDSTGDLRAMSADGSVMVGGNTIWDANNGARSLIQVIVDSGFAGFENWSSINAISISADGRTIVGEATNPQGDQEGWRVVLP
ncbi:MAG: putative Ig domain-containing protein [Nitrospira sp.]|nr:putative Ig domain-containing protein [Nitrospira sp.]MCW5781588.1 putative Ig domain-containing protein [Nitrospira sp.]